MLQSVKELPEHYHLNAKLDLAERKGLALVLNLVAGVSAIGYLLLFGFLAFTLRPTDAPAALQVQITGISNLLVLALRLMAATVVMLLLHEGVHGLCFRLYTGEWGTFAFKGLYAYAGAPDWYLPRNQHLVTTLAPLVGISLVGVLLITFVPRAILPDLLLLLVLNASGAMGDVAVVAWLLTKPRHAYIKDYGDGVAIHLPGEESASSA